MSCEICGKIPSETHEFYSRGRYGKAALVPENQIELCADDHRLDGKSAHNLGRDRFARLHGLEERVRVAEVAVRSKEREILQALNAYLINT